MGDIRILNKKTKKPEFSHPHMQGMTATECTDAVDVDPNPTKFEPAAGTGGMPGRRGRAAHAERLRLTRRGWQLAPRQKTCLVRDISGVISNAFQALADK